MYGVIYVQYIAFVPKDTYYCPIETIFIWFFGVIPECGQTAPSGLLIF